MAAHWFLTVSSVLEEIKSWRPRGCQRELDFRNSLYDKLVEAFKSPPTKEYGHGRARADIAFETKIAIELKHDLNAHDKLQRLKGQLDDYAENFGNTIVVLTGDSDPGLVKDLKRTADKYGILVVEK